MVIQAENRGNHELAVQIYAEIRLFPQTETTDELKERGYLLDFSPYAEEKLTLCYKFEPDGRLTPHVLKMLSDSEWTRAVAFKEALGSLSHAGVTTFTLHQSVSNKKMMIMPYHPSTLASIGTLESIVSLREIFLNRLWDQLASAVRFIHSLGFVHLVIKSSNFCFDQNGRYILIDLGSIVPLRMNSSPTVCYLPSDMQPAYETSLEAHPNIDWWMLAMVFAEKRGKARPGRVPRGSEPSREELKTLLTEHILGELLQLIVE